MNFNCVRLHKYNDGTPTTWVFNSGKGHLRSFWCLNGTEKQLSELKDGLLYALFNIKSPVISEAYIEASDHSGHYWKVDRKSGQLTVFKDDNLVDLEICESEFQKALLDSDQDETEILKYADLKIFGEGKSLSALPLKNQVTHKTKLERQIERVSERALSRIGQLLGTEKDINKIKVYQATQKIEQTSLELEALNQQKLFLTEKEKTLNVHQDFSVERIRNQLSVIHKVESLLEQLENPSQTLQQLNNDLYNLQESFSEALAACHVESLPKLEMANDFELLINAICRKKAYEKLVIFLGEARKKAESDIEPLFLEYQNMIESSLIKDIESLESIEVNLSFVGSQTKDIEIQLAKTTTLKQRVKAALIEWKSKVFNQDPTKQLTSKDEAKLIKSGAKITELANSLRLSREGLRDIYHNLNSHECTHQELMSKIDELFEKQIYEYQKIKSAWSKASKKYAIPEDISIKDLIKLIVNFSMIQNINKKISQTKTAINTRKQKLTELSDLVKEWKQLIQSQKPYDSSNSAILFSEAKSIMRYKQDREKLLEILIRRDHEMASWSEYFRFIKTRIQSCQDKLKILADDLKIKHIPSDQNVLTEVIELGRFIRSLDNISKEEAEKPDFALFSNSKYAESINFWHLDKDLVMGPEHQQQFFRQLQKNAACQLHILLTSDHELAKQLQKVGMGQANMIVNPLHNHVSEMPSLDPVPRVKGLTIDRKVSHPPTKPTLSLDEKTQELLDIFNGKTINRLKRDKLPG